MMYDNYVMFFVSGWSMPDHFFSPLVDKFVKANNNLDCHVVNFGYYSDDNIDFIKKCIIDARLKNKKIVVITHSFGISGFVDLFSGGCDYLFSICGFTYFREDWRDYNFLLKLFNKDSRRCLQYFHSLCGLDASVGDYSIGFRKQILEDKLLNIRDFIFFDNIHIGMKVSLLSRRDKVMPYDLSFRQFSELGYSVFSNDVVGHSLGYDEGRWCFDIMVDVLKVI